MEFTEAQQKEIKKIIEKTIAEIPRQQTHQSDIRQGTIKKRHLEDVIIVFGLSAARPVNDKKGVRAYWATDTGVLSIWTGTQWLSETFT